MCCTCSPLVPIPILGSLSPPPQISACCKYLGSQKDLPLKGDMHLWVVLFSLGCAGTKGVWQTHLAHLHPILGRNCSLQLSNSEHVCFGVFLW